MPGKKSIEMQIEALEESSMVMPTVVQICTDEDELFRVIQHADLKDLVRKKGRTIAEKQDLLVARSRETRVARTSEADYTLVLDGTCDKDSWEELEDNFE